MFQRDRPALTILSLVTSMVFIDFILYLRTVTRNHFDGTSWIYIWWIYISWIYIYIERDNKGIVSNILHKFYYFLECYIQSFVIFSPSLSTFLLYPSIFMHILFLHLRPSQTVLDVWPSSNVWSISIDYTVRENCFSLPAVIRWQYLLGQW